MWINSGYLIYSTHPGLRTFVGWGVLIKRSWVLTFVAAPVLAGLCSYLGQSVPDSGAYRVQSVLTLRMRAVHSCPPDSVAAGTSSSAGVLNPRGPCPIPLPAGPARPAPGGGAGGRGGTARGRSRKGRWPLRPLPPQPATASPARLPPPLPGFRVTVLNATCPGIKAPPAWIPGLGPMETPPAVAGAWRGEARAAGRGRRPRGRTEGIGRAPAGTDPRGGRWGRSLPASPGLGTPPNLAQVGGPWDTGDQGPEEEPRKRGARGQGQPTRHRRPAANQSFSATFSADGSPQKLPLPLSESLAKGPVPPGPEPRAPGGGNGLSGEAPGTPTHPPLTSNPRFP